MPQLVELLGALRASSDEDLLRRAAARVMDEALARIAGPEASGALFAACDALSAEAWERADARGTLLLAARGHPSLDLMLELVAPVPLRATRAARKLLQLSRAGLAPVADGAAIWGLGRVAPHDPAREDLFEVRFSGRARWQLCHGGGPLFVVANRRPSLPEPPLSRERFEALVHGALPAPGVADLERLWEAVSAVVAADCGSTVVVSGGAADEARRLSPQGTPVAPRLLAPEVLEAATGIGGAILLDPSGICHAIGVILDGVATRHGNPSRGSRFHSAANYVAGRPGTVAVVVSDDGPVDLFAS